MAISVQGTPASAAATTVTLPAHQAGDLIVISARGTAAAPTVPTGYTSAQSGIANSIGLSTGWKIADTASETSGTWTNATHLVAIVLRADSGLIGVGTSSSGNGTTVQTIVYPALTLKTTDGTSFGLRFGTRVTAATTVATAPTNWTNQVVQPAGASALIAGHSRSGLVANPTADTVNTTGTNAAYRAHTLEVTELLMPIVTAAPRRVTR